MQPYLFGGVQAYPFFLGLGIALGAVTAARGLHRSGVTYRKCLPLLAALAALGLVGAKLNLLYERDWALLSLTGELTHGYRYPGAVAGTLIALVLARPLLGSPASLATLSDALAPAIGLSAAVARLGCFFSGCCFGKVSWAPWAIRFPADSPAWQAHVALGWIGASVKQSMAVHPPEDDPRREHQPRNRRTVRRAIKTPPPVGSHWEVGVRTAVTGPPPVRRARVRGSPRCGE